MTRRNFIQSGTVASAAVMSAVVLPRHVLGGGGYVSPNDKINLGYVGCGIQGMRHMTMDILPNPHFRITAVCDPNRISEGYIGGRENNNWVRDLINDPHWAEDAKSAVCGREVGRYVTKQYYAQQSGGSPAAVALGEYLDFREMLETQKDIDAVFCATPDHLHGVVAMRAMRAGKHIISQKPMSNILDEARQLRDMSRKTDVATQLFCGVSYSTDAHLVGELLASGVIGTVQKVVCVLQGDGPGGMLNPTDTPPIPDGFDWNLWTGPAAERAYHPTYTHGVFRGWYDFGSGSLGDTGTYTFYQVFRALGLASPPRNVQATRSEFGWTFSENGRSRQPGNASFPQASRVSWEFAHPAITGATIDLHWYDGGITPPDDEWMAWAENGDSLLPPDGYILYFGSEGMILCDHMGGNPKWKRYPNRQEFVVPALKSPFPIPEIEQFVKACRGEAKSEATFESAYLFNETILLGNIALRVPRKKLKWDSENFEFTNSDEANALKFRKNRPGWEL